MRITAALAVAFLTLTSFAAASEAQAAIRRPTNIPPQALRPALHLLSKEREFQVIFRTDVVADVKTQGATGELTVDEALTKLLAGTGLTYRYLDNNTVTILPETLPAADGGMAPRSGEEKARVRVAQADPHGMTKVAEGQDKQTAAADTAEQASGERGIAEIIVTAQKRAERLIDVPQSVSVLSAETLARLDALQFRDFANTVPGLSFWTAGPGYTQVTLRGVSVGFDQSPTVAIYYDDVPMGSNTAFGGGNYRTFDAALFGIERVEVLRGPQGTLYGVGSMGGLLKYVSKSPDPTRFSGDARAGVSQTQSGSASYYGGVELNAPIIRDKLAVRASAFGSHDGGYFDNALLGQEDVNRSDIYGGKLDILATPTDAFTIRVTGLVQNSDADGNAFVNYTPAGQPIAGELDQLRAIEEPFKQRVRLASGVVKYDFGPVALTSVSAHQTMVTTPQADISVVYVPAFQALYGRTYSAVANNSPGEVRKFTQELRLASDERGALDWVLGGFYLRENAALISAVILRDATGAPAVNDILSNYNPSRFEEVAGFGNLTWHLTSRFDVSAGTRYAHNELDFTQTGTGRLAVNRPKVSSSDSVATYSLSLQYRFNDLANVYARYATGYRPGGPNFTLAALGNAQSTAPTEFEADTLKSYEVGFKGEFLDRRYAVDLAVYTIDWNNIQTFALRDNQSVRINAAGGATIRGAELTLTARPFERFVATGAFAYTDAGLSERDADLNAAKGERLPWSPRISGALSADYRLPLDLGDQTTLGATLRYVGDRTTSLGVTTIPPYTLPSYSLWDVRAATVFGSVTAQLYVRNVLDERAQLAGFIRGNLATGNAELSIAQPRTVGISLTTQF